MPSHHRIIVCANCGNEHPQYARGLCRTCHRARPPCDRQPDSSPWLDIDTNDALLAMAEQGLSTAEIGRRLGMTKNACVGRLWRLGQSEPQEVVPTLMDRLDKVHAKMDKVLKASAKVMSSGRGHIRIEAGEKLPAWVSAAIPVWGSIPGRKGGAHSTVRAVSVAVH